MKAIILNSLLFFVFVFNIANAQEVKDVDQFGINITPKITKQFFDDSENGNGNNLLGFSLGLDYFYSVSSKVTFKTGLTYNLFRVDQKDFSLTFACDLNSNTGPFTGFDLSNSWIEDQYKIHFVGIPIEAIIDLLGDQNRLYTRLGIEVQMKMGESSKTVLVECHTNRREIESNPAQELTKLLLQMNFGIGYQLKLQETKYLYIEPQINYTPSNIFKENNLVNNSKLFSLGIMLGMKF